jgi:hypothetical protein
MSSWLAQSACHGPAALRSTPGQCMLPSLTPSHLLLTTLHGLWQHLTSPVITKHQPCATVCAVLDKPSTRNQAMPCHAVLCCAWHRSVELLGEKTPVTLVARPAAAAADIIAAGDKLHDATKFRAQKLFMQVCTRQAYCVMQCSRPWPQAWPALVKFPVGPCPSWTMGRACLCLWC